MNNNYFGKPIFPNQSFNNTPPGNQNYTINNTNSNIVFFFLKLEISFNKL